MSTYAVRLQKHKVLLGYVFALIAGLIYAALPTIGKSVLIDSSINPIPFSALICLAASATLLPVSRSVVRPSRLVIAIALTGAVVAPLAFGFGLKYTSASHAGILTNTEILFTTVIAITILRQKIQRLGILGAGLVTVGVFVVAGVANIGSGNIFGDLLIVLSALFYAFDSNLMSKSKSSAFVLIGTKFLIGAVILVVLTISFHIPFDFSPQQLLKIIFLGAVGFGLGMVLFYASLTRIGAIRCTMVASSTFNIFVLLFAYIFLDEMLPLLSVLASICLICMGIYLLARTEHVTEEK